MAVTGHWQREWAGAAEYGKVTEDGITRQVTRAVEVMHAKAPGARVRVMRAAYHSSAGPGVPASTFMLHSSRRVISSGSRFLESPSYPSKALEISSTPLEASPESMLETENYKVTEPDDTDISEPSKWRGTTGTGSIRMPSEESSSTDNASIIDLDSKTNGNNRFTRNSYDSDNSDIQPIKKSTRVSPLLDAPVTLSTLKYKSILNDWSNRRKSYSFEETESLDDTTLSSTDKLAMESSTDSGICKSTEKVNEPSDDGLNIKHFRIMNMQGKNNDYKVSTIKSYAGDYHPEESIKNNITLQSRGKLSITVPVIVEKDDYQYRKNHISDEGNRRIKKVEFCKTELHFAAESGKVNIIATDEKPPPTNDFRKRRSAFVPLKANFEKPITLFGDKEDDYPEYKKLDSFSTYNNSENSDNDENTAATKSILKNKIPKPKPYLLGENMVLGNLSDVINGNNVNNDCTVLTAVSLINKQLENERHNVTSAYNYSKMANTSVNNDMVRTNNRGPIENGSQVIINNSNELLSTTNVTGISTSSPVKQKLKILEMSPIEQRAKTRQLRESDLTYFGVNKNKDSVRFEYKNNTPSPPNHTVNDTFHSVRLVKRISNSACNSEAESDDVGDYENINFNINPSPKPRTKFTSTLRETENSKILLPIIEQSMEITCNSRRSRSRRNEESLNNSSRSISEPPKPRRRISTEKCHYYAQNKKFVPSVRHKISEHNKDKNLVSSYVEERNNETSDEDPIYVNMNVEEKGHVKNALTRQIKKSELYTDKNIKVKVIRGDRRSEHNKSRLKTKKDEDKLQKQHNFENISKFHSANKQNNENVSENNRKPDKSNENENLMRDLGKSNSKVIRAQRNRSSQRLIGNESNTLSRKRNRSHNRDDVKQLQAKSKDSDSSKSSTRIRSSDKNGNQNDYSKLCVDYDVQVSNPQNNLMNENKDPINHTNSSKNKIYHHNKYVINYDDKNGTVSSICKIKPEALHKKRIMYEKMNENTNNKGRVNLADKLLLQQPEQKKKQKGPRNAVKWKKNLRRSCQLL